MLSSHRLIAGPLGTVSAQGINPAFNSLIAYMGDSQTANSIVKSGVDIYYPTNGFISQMLPMSGNTLRMGVGYNKGIAGQTTAQMLARFATDILALNPKPSAVVIEGGINDIMTGISGATVVGNIKAMSQAAIGAGILPILTTILPTFSTYALTAPMETERVAANVGVIALAGLNTVVADPVSAYSWSASDFADGLHVNATGAAKWGRSIGTALTPRLTPGNVLGLLSVGTNWNVNLPLAGSGGSPAGMPDFYTLDMSASGGAAAAVSKDADGGLIITVSGNYTGDNSQFVIYTQGPPAPQAGDTFEGIAKVQLLANTPNIAGYSLSAQGLDGSFADVGLGFGNVVSILASDGAQIVRTPSVLLTSSATYLVTALRVYFSPVGTTSAAISIKFKLFGMGVHNDT